MVVAAMPERAIYVCADCKGSRGTHYGAMVGTPPSIAKSTPAAADGTPVHAANGGR